MGNTLKKSELKCAVASAIEDCAKNFQDTQNMSFPRWVFAHLESYIVNAISKNMEVEDD